MLNFGGVSQCFSLGTCGSQVRQVAERAEENDRFMNDMQTRFHYLRRPLPLDGVENFQTAMGFIMHPQGFLIFLRH